VADPSETTQVSESPTEVETRELLDAVRSLAAQVGSLQADVHALRTEGSALPAQGDAHGWDERPVASQQSPPWVRSLDSPGTRRPGVPWLALEIAFLVAVAVIAALARVDPVVIVVVMAAAWGVVAAAEWLNAREGAKREASLLRSGLAAAVVRDDASWFGPPVVAPTEQRPALDDATAARLPPLED
jgi:outer membrane murein-binding lipoprotein Lpp